VWARHLPVAPAGCAVPEDVAAGRCAGVPVPVIRGYWDWELAENTGVAFSKLDGQRALLSLVAALAFIALVVAAARTRPEQRVRRVALAAIAGGALGNQIDRIRDGSVTDFVRWHVHGHMWPVFNVADAALLLGVGLLLVEHVIPHPTAARGDVQ
jgi:lipoprotein signal peptidase